MNHNTVIAILNGIRDSVNRKAEIILNNDKLDGWALVDEVNEMIDIWLKVIKAESEVDE